MKTIHKQNLLAAALICTLASVATTARAAASDEAPWQFGVTLPLWAAGINGNATILGHQQNLNVSFDTLKDHLDAAVALGFDVSKGKFGIYSDVNYMKFSGGFTGPLGGNTSADLKFVLANAGVSYQLVKTDGEHPFTLAGTAGVRYWYADTSLSHSFPPAAPDWSGGKTLDVVDPVIGLRASQYLTQKLHLDVSGDFGGFNISHNTDLTWSAMGVATYDFAKWFSLSAGYKAVALDESVGSGASKNGVNLIFNGALVSLNFRW